jgi:hypothetical protein
MRFGTAIAAITAVIAAVPLALFALTPASASSSTVTIVISTPGTTARHLESAFAAHHFKIKVTERRVSDELVGSILSVGAAGASSDDAGAIGEVQGRCKGGTLGCIDGLVLPQHYSGTVLVTLGVKATSKVVRRPLARNGTLTSHK